MAIRRNEQNGETGRVRRPRGRFRRLRDCQAFGLLKAKIVAREVGCSSPRHPASVLEPESQPLRSAGGTWRYFEKLRMPSASVSETSKTVNSLVTCSTSWNLAPRWQRRTDAPRVDAL